MAATPIYHFTHEANLAGILATGALLCDRFCHISGAIVRNIAYLSLKQQRADTVVEVAPWGTLADYVPFYFGTRSPMLFTYKNGNVTGRQERQDELVYFATTAEKIAESGLPFAFSDGHPIKEPKHFFNDLGQLSSVDLPLMTQRMWNDTNADPDRKRRRQAEFLVRERVPLTLIMVVGTKTDAKRDEIAELVGSHFPNAQRQVRPDWYY